MTRMQAGLTVGAALSFALLQSGCMLLGKRQPVVAATPPPPQPVEVAKAAPQSEPLSVPQTQVQLPPAQPVNLDGLPPATKAEEPAVIPVAPPPTRRTPPAQSTPKPAENAATNAATAAPPAAAPPAAQPPAEPIGPVQEVLSPEERDRLWHSVEDRKHEINGYLAKVKPHHTNAELNREVKLIQSLMDKCEAAEKRGELREADALALRAQILAQEILGGKQ